MADAQTITYAFVGNASSLVGAAGAATGALNAVEGAAGKTLGALGSIVAGAAKATAALAAIGAGAAAALGGSAIKVAADFEQQISAIAAVSSKTEVATVGGMKAISAAALELGKTTSFSATEAAAGMEEMVKAGVSLTDVMGGGAKAALDLAAAGALEVSEAATIASSAMNAFALSGKDLPAIADTLANAANASATDVHQLGLGLASVGAVAHTVGLSFEDTTTALAMFAQAGLKGSDSGTSFKTMLLGLTPSTKPAIATMKELGLITADGSNQFFDAQGKVKDFATISGILQKATAGLTQEQKLNALQTMFGTDAIRVAAIMAEKGAEGANALTQAQKEVGGASAVAKERLNNLKGALEALGGSWEVIRIKIGTPFLPILTKGAQALTEALNKAEPAISAFAERAAAGLDALITRATVAGPRFLAMGTGLLAFGRQGLALAQNVLPRLVEQVKAFVSSFSLGGAATGAQSLVGGLIGAFQQIEPVLMTVGRAIVSNITDTFTFLQTRVLPPVVSIIQQVGAVLERTLLPVAAATGAVMRGIFGDTLDWLAKTVMPPFLSIVTQTANFWTQVMLPTLPALAAALRTTLGETVQWLSTDVWPKLRIAAELAWGFISGTIIPALPGLARQLRDVLGGALQWIGETGWPALVKGATAAWAFLQGKIIPVVKDAYDWLKVKLPEAIGAVVSAFETIRGKVGPIVEAALHGDIAGAIKNLGTAFAAFATLAAGWLGDQVSQIKWDQVWAQATDAASTLAAYLMKQAVDLAAWLGAQAARIPWASVWQRTVEAAAALATYLSKQAVDFATWLGAQVAKIPWATVWTQIKNAATALATYLQRLAVDFATWLGEQVEAIPWDRVWSQSKLTAQQVVDGIAANAGALDVALTGWLQRQLETIKWNDLGVFVGQSLVAPFVTGTQSAIDAVGPQLKPDVIRAAIRDFFVGVITGAWDEILAYWRAQTPGETFGSVFVQGLDTAGLPAATTNVFQRVLDAYLAFQAKWNISVLDGLRQIFDAFQQWAGRLLAALGQLQQALWELWSRLWDALWQRAGEALDSIWGLIQQKGADIVGAFTQWIPQWAQAGLDMANALINAVGTALDGLLERVTGPIKRAVDAVKGMLGTGSGGAGAATPASGTPQAMPSGPLTHVDTSSSDAAMRSWMPALQDAERRTGIPAEQLWALIWAENRGGQSPLSSDSNNYFSISRNPERQYQAGTAPGGRFASYATPQDSLEDFIDLISSNPRYAEAWQNRQDPDKFTQGLIRGGYIVNEPGFPISNWTRNLESGRQNFREAAPSMQTVGMSGPPPGTTAGKPLYVSPIEGMGPAQLHHGSFPGASDIFAPRGTPIHSIGGGTVTGAGDFGPGGFAVMVKGDDGLEYYYAHMQDAPAVQKGQRVEAGQVIGAVGDTGNARGTGPHLHLGIGEQIMSGLGPQGGAGSNFNAVQFLNDIRDGKYNAPIRKLGDDVQLAGDAFGHVQEEAAATTPQLAAIGASIDPVVAAFSEGTVSATQMTDAIILSAMQQGVGTEAATLYSQGLISQDQAMQGVLAGFAATTPAAAELLAQLQAGTITTDQAAVGFAGLATSTATATGAIGTMAAEVPVLLGALGTAASEQMTALGLTLVTSTTDSMGAVVQTYTDSTGQMTTLVTDATGIVIGQYTTSGQTAIEMAAKTNASFQTVANAARTPIEPIGQYKSAVMSIPTPNMGDTVKQFGAVAEAAKKAQKAIKDLADASEDLPGSFGGSKGGKSSGLAKKASGGWTQGLTLVGEMGPEFISPQRPMYVTDAATTRAMRNGDGGGTTTITVTVNVEGSVTSERDLVEAVRSGLIEVGRRNGGGALGGLG